MSNRISLCCLQTSTLISTNLGAIIGVQAQTRGNPGNLGLAPALLRAEGWEITASTKGGDPEAHGPQC